MARSSYIYIVQGSSERIAGAVIATFTVKHECAKWLRRYFLTGVHGHLRPDEFEVVRHPDNPPTIGHEGMGVCLGTVPLFLEANP